MQRIATATKAIDLFGAGKHGFKDGDLALGIPSTDMSAAWVNGVQEELVNLIEAAGLVASGATLNQIVQAIAILQRQQTNTAFPTTGAAPNFVLTPTLPITAYAPNQRFRVKFNASGAGTDMINVSVLGNKSLKQYDGNGIKVAAVIVAGQLADIEYDGVDFVILDPLPTTIVPQNLQSAAYALVLTDGGKHILHPGSDVIARTYTIPANAAVAFPAGTAITFVNQHGAGVVTIAITTDTMRLAGVGTTGNRTLSANGIATALKLTATEWIISGTGLS